MIKVQKSNDVEILSFDGINKLNVLVAQQAKEEILKIANKEGAKLILDLKEIHYIDSTGFGVLLSLLRTTKNNHGKLRLTGVSPEVMELVKLLQLQNVFEIHSDPDSALKSF